MAASGKLCRTEQLLQAYHVSYLSSLVEFDSSHAKEKKVSRQATAEVIDMCDKQTTDP